LSTFRTQLATASRPWRLGIWSIAALVLLRLAIGWHFFQEGTQKFTYDAAEGRLRIVFSAEVFMRQAVGPLAGLFHAQVPDTHGWPNLLATARQNKPLTTEQEEEQARWAADYQARRAAAAKNKQPVPIEFPPFAPYHDWAVRIVDDWRNVLADVTAIPGLSDDQRRQAADAFVLRQQQLADYLTGETGAITDYQNELWRLGQMQAAPVAHNLPYQQERIAAKAAETRGMPLPWLGQVQVFQAGYFRDLDDVVRGSPDPAHVARSGDRPQQIAAAMDDALTEPRQAWLGFVNVAVAVLTLSVGGCLLLGLLTPIAAIFGAGFLLAIVATQPPWVTGAEPTYYQCVELAGLLVLAATGAGRWAGLDYFLAALWQKLRRPAAN
jgi:uncharacterized membrane protein YphA (DoxX/SURF4 family)